MNTKLNYHIFIMAVLSIASYNSHGHGTGRFEYIEKVSNQHDFVFIQEHWLFQDQMSVFEDKISGVNVHGTSSMSSTTLHHGRPYGGCAIIWKNSIVCKVKPVNLESKRLCAVLVKFDDIDMLLFNVYMPCDSINLTEFDDVILDIERISTELNISNIVIGGDFNTDLARTKSVQSKHLLDFCLNDNYKLVIDHPTCNVDYTYESKITGDRSIIDHFIVTENLFEFIVLYESKHDGDNMSDHAIVSMVIDIPVTYYECGDNCNVKDTSLKWSDATASDIAYYVQCLDNLLSNVKIPWHAIHCKEYTCVTHKQDINVYFESLICASIQAAKECIPSRKQKESKSNIPGWKMYVEEHRQTAIFWHNIWKDNNSPRSGILADIRKRTRAKYHYSLRFVKRNRDMCSQNKLAECILEDKSRNFWSEVKKLRGSSKVAPNNIDSSVGDEQIGNMFANKYKDLYNCVSFNVSDMNALKDNISEAIEERCCRDSCYCKHSISVDDIIAGIKHLKHNKKDGSLGHSTDHLINASHNYYVHLSLVLSAMLRHGFMPDNFVLSTIISIPKNKKKSLNDSDNYRGIALSNVVGKLYDWILLMNHEHIFRSSDMQFGFKEDHSTTMYSYVVQETIQYYSNNNSSVYVTLLDASKAFDRVNYVKLFELLMSRGICPLTARFLLNMYTNQQIRIKWGKHITNSFSVSNGVKQGGVLSPILFSVYMDELLQRFKNSKIGCHIGHIYVGALAYADDVTLLTPNRQGLIMLLNIANNFSKEYDVQFNPDKSRLLIFNNNNQDNSFANVLFNGKPTEISNNELHLGNSIGCESHVENVKYCINNVYAKLNLISAQFNHVYSWIKYKLFKTYCMPLYGCQLWDFSHKSVNLFFTAWRKCIRRIWNLPLRAHNVLLNLICDDFKIETQLHKRIVKLIHSIVTSKNECVNICGKMSLNGSRSNLVNSINYICYRYGLNKV